MRRVIRQHGSPGEIFLLSRACARVRVKKSTNIALERLDIIFPTFAPYVLPFAVQPQGTARLGRAFGPIMALWFATIAVLGVMSIVQTPHILWAFSPHYAVEFFVRDPIRAFLALGSVVLAVTALSDRSISVAMDLI